MLKRRLAHGEKKAAAAEIVENQNHSCLKIELRFVIKIILRSIKKRRRVENSSGWCGWEK